MLSGGLLSKEERTKNRKCARTHTYGEDVEDEKCGRTPRPHKEPIFGRAINMHSRRPTEQ